MAYHLFTFVSAGISAIINLFLVFLLIRQKPAKKANLYLTAWLIFLTLLIQIAGCVIMTAKESETAFFLYTTAGSTIGLFAMFWFFVNEFLKTKRKKWLNQSIFLYIVFLFLIFIIKPEIIIKDVRWDQISNFYLASANPRGFFIIFPLAFIIGDALRQLVSAYKKSRSAIEKNRLKYLFLGGVFPYVGMILIAIPQIFLHRFPVDMWGVTLTSIFLSYAVLRYRLLDINIIVKKGLIYSIITAVITAIYLLFALSMQAVFPGQATTISISTIFSTALIVSLIFQPLQITTQRLVARLFFKKDYDPEALINHLSSIFSKTIELKILAKMVLEEICTALKVERGAIFVLDEKNQSLKVTIGRNISSEIKKIEIESESPLTKLLSQDSKPWLAITIKDKGIEKMTEIEKIEPGLEIFIPLIGQRKFLGFICLGSKTSGKIYNLEEINLLETIGRATSLALDNALLFEELSQEKKITEEAKADLEKRVNELERFKKSVIGRELKMIELKKKLDKFKTKKETRDDFDT